MYEAFYGLTEKPFNLTPDPRFLYLSKKHKEAFAHLLYGIRDRCGFVMISGEIGTGKTTICRSLLKQLDPDTLVAFIFNPKLSPVELLKTINSDFGIRSTADTVRGLIGELNEFLLEKSAQNMNCVLIIDEAQNIGPETLEQVRLLSNLETETKKLLQIVLIGQPELAEQLELTELRQLNQRITARYHLGALSRDETLHYIAFRLRVAGGRKKIRFTRRAVKLIYRISGGTPRVINAICDRALLIGYTKETHVINHRIVKQAAKEVHGDFHARRVPLNVSRMLPASALASIALVAGLGYLLLSGSNPVRGWLAAAGDLLVSAPVQETAPAELSTNPVADDSADPAESFEPEPASDSSSAAGNVAEAAIRTMPAPAEVTSETLDAGSEPVEQGSATPAPEFNVAANELLEVWGVAPVSDLALDASGFEVRRFFRSHGLRAASIASTIEELLIVNLPVVLRTTFEGAAGWAVWMASADEEARVVFPDGSTESVALDVLSTLYAGEAVCVWRDPAPATPILRAMVEDEAVTELQNDLQSLGLLDRTATGIYDAATVDAVSRIQQATGLITDGIYGPNTRMVVTSWAPRHDMPHLMGTAFPESARARVLRAEGMVRAEAFARDSIPLPGEEALASVSGDPLALTNADVESDGPELVETSNTETATASPVIETTVGVETLSQPAYEPLLEDATLGVSPDLTDPLGPAAPIVPRADAGDGEGAVR